VNSEEVSFFDSTKCDLTNCECCMLNDLVPKRITTIRGKKPVINPTIQNLKNKKSRLYKKWRRSNHIDDLEALNKVSKLLNKEIRLERKKQFTDNLTVAGKNYWETINKFCMPDRDNIPTSFVKPDGQPVTGDQVIANAFNEFFTDKVEGLVKDSEVDNFIVPNLSVEGGEGEWFNDNLFFRIIDVEKAIKSSASKKSVGPDEVPNKILKDIIEVVCEPLTWLFNSILLSGNFPKAWKISKITPVFKKGKKDQLNNYRPVCLTSSIGKIFEKCLVNRLVLKCDFDHLMGIHQNAYRPGHSTVTACLGVQDYVCSQLDQGKNVLMYSTDLTAAFDLLRPNIMVKILLEKRVPLLYIRIIEDFMSKRLGYVSYNNSNSDLVKIPVGCVQGSVLGPFLFNIYSSDLPNLIKAACPEASVCAYADDAYVAIPFCPTNLDTTLERTSRVIKEHISWLTSIGMKCNNSKTEAIIFGHCGQRCSLNVEGSMIQIEDTIKILGITFEKNLKWNVHVGKMLKRANSSSYALRQLNHLLPRKLHKTVIHSYFLSHILYGLPVWGGCISLVDRNRVNKVLFKIMRLHCFDFKREKSNLELCNQSGLRNFESLRITCDTIMLHRLCHKPESSLLTTRLIQQSFTIDRNPGRIYFFDASSKRVGRTSFINRAKAISELIPFPWPDLSFHAFKKRIKQQVPLLIRS